MLHRLCASLWLLAFLLCGLSFAQRGGGGGKGPSGGLKGNIGPNRSAGPLAKPNLINPGSTPNYHHADEEAKVEFKSNTILVQVPVVVTDKSGKHILDMSLDDFQLYEDGKAKKITSFEEVEPAQTPLTTPPSANGEFSNLAAASEAPRTVTIIALDTVNTPFLDQAYGRKQIIRYLAENVTSDQVIALVAITSKGLKPIHALTSDPKILVDALKKVNGEIPSLQGTDVDTQAVAAGVDGFAPRAIEAVGLGTDPNLALEDFVLRGDATLVRMQQDRAIEITMRSFLTLAWSLSGIPGRKSLVWATSGFPFYIDQPSAVPVGYLAALYEETMQALNDAEISIYPVDVRGLVNYSPSADVTYAPRNSSNLSGSAYAASLASRSWLHNSTLDTLRDFAEMTGGRAFYNSNDITGGVRRAANDSSSYYLLGYYLDTTNTKPGWRKLKVSTHRKNIEIRARNGFFVTNATANPAVSRRADMQFAVTSPFESTGIGITVKWLSDTTDGDKKKVGFVMTLPGDSFAQVQEDKPGFDLDVLSVAIKDGVAANSLSQTVRGTPTAETLAKLKAGGLAYKNAIELPPGKYTVRFVVRDNLNGKIGSVSAPLTVN